MMPHANSLRLFSDGRYTTLAVVGSEGSLAFDPLSARVAERMAGALRGAPPLAGVVYSHRHADHATGADILLEGGSGAIFAAPAHGEELPAGVAEPTHIVLRRETISLGDIDVELIPVGHTHSADTLVAWVPQLSVVYAVDFANADYVGYRDLPGADLDGIVAALDLLLSIPFETAVLGHGGRCDRATVERQRQYWAWLIEQVDQRLGAGDSENEAVASIEIAEPFAEWRMVAEWFPLNVRAVYRARSAN